MAEWKWFKVSMDLGVEADVEIPTDPFEFLKWLVNEQPDKLIDGLALHPAELTTAS